MTLTQINERIALLELALASGHETVRFADRTITYRSVADMERALAYLKRQKAILEGKRQGFSVASFS